MRALSYVLFTLFVLFLLAGLLSDVRSAYDGSLLETAKAATAPDLFDETGAITWYGQSDGLQPWLVYETGSGVATKSLTCGACPKDERTFEREFGAREVHVTGIVTNEHVTVRRIGAAAFDSRIEFIAVRLGGSGNASGVTLTPRIAGNEGSDALVVCDVTHDGTTESTFFKQGTLVPVGLRTASLLFERNGEYRFAVFTP